MSINRIEFPGSELPEAARHRVLSLASPKKRVRFTLHLHHRKPLPVDRYSLAQPSDRKYLKRKQFIKRHAPGIKEFQQVKSFAESHGLRIVEHDAFSSTVVLEGRVSDCNQALGIKIHKRQDVRGTHRGFSGVIRIPAELANVVAGVTGVDNAPIAERLPAIASGTYMDNSECWFPREVAELYDFPATDGCGETVGIVQLGGGYDPRDIRGYFKLNDLSVPDITYLPKPRFLDTTTIPAADRPYVIECAADLQIAGTIAPAASYVIYFADSTHDGILNAYYNLLSKSPRRPTIISISYVIAEELVSKQQMSLFNRAAQVAAALGVTTCVASGDGGSPTHDALKIWPPGIMPHVNYPANSPYVLACGGTSLQARDGRITSEVAWNNLAQVVSATGGGISTVFGQPSYQAWAGVPVRAGTMSERGRGVPDVASDADPLTGYKLMLGQEIVQNMGGTSCSAPLWAGLIARINHAMGVRCGFLNPWLYVLANSGGLRSITSGGNGAYCAAKRWDACTGLGAPHGKRLLQALRTGMLNPHAVDTTKAVGHAAIAATAAEFAKRSARDALIT